MNGRTGVLQRVGKPSLVGDERPADDAVVAVVEVVTVTDVDVTNVVMVTVVNDIADVVARDGVATNDEMNGVVADGCDGVVAVANGYNADSRDGVVDSNIKLASTGAYI